MKRNSAVAFQRATFVPLQVDIRVLSRWDYDKTPPTATFYRLDKIHYRNAVDIRAISNKCFAGTVIV